MGPRSRALAPTSRGGTTHVSSWTRTGRGTESPYGTCAHYVVNKYTNCAKRPGHGLVGPITQRSPAALGDIVLAAAPAAEGARAGEHERASSQPLGAASVVDRDNDRRPPVGDADRGANASLVSRHPA